LAEQPFPMIQRLIRIGGSRNRIQQDRQNLGELAAMMRIARHRLQIAVSLIDIVQAVRREDRPDLLRITFSSEENRPGVWLRGNGLNWLLRWLRRICF
ncbi:MAG: hypothetical protein AAB433_17445, partial [Nitrospirota bacterium]